MSEFQIRDLAVRVGEKPILRGVTLDVRPGEVHALMGPNGSGKSTLAATLTGHPGYTVTGGSAAIDGHDLLAMTPDARSRAGIFLSFQYPLEIPGLRYGQFLHAALQAHRGTDWSMQQSYALIAERLKLLGLDDALLERSLNEGFSGGEKKRAEMLQLAVLEPDWCILDETDSGLDIDALKIVASSINALRSSDRGWLIITHYRRLLDLVRPDRVSVMTDGKIVRTGGPELVADLEQHGYASARE